MISIFLSHTHADKPFARQLTERLKAHGVRVWLDEAEMQVGDSLISKIESAIRDCTYLGVVLSKSSVCSEWVQREVNMAISDEIQGRRVKVLPILYDVCEVPGFLKNKLYADFTKDFDSGFQLLRQRLDSDLREESYKQRRAYEILQEGYQDWIVFSKKDNHLFDRLTAELVIEYVTEPLLSLDLLEYLFCGLSLIKKENYNPLNEEPLRKWLPKDPSQLLDRLLNHPNPKVRAGALALFSTLADNSVVDRVLRVVHEEIDLSVRRQALLTANRLGAELPEDLAGHLIESDSDLVVQSYALRALNEKQGCLIISDGTDFAVEIGALISASGFHLVPLITSFGSFELKDIHEDLMRAYPLVVLVRGEHFTQYGNEKFYDRIQRFVESGGTLFATSWVSWETKYHQEFANVLPFRHIQDTYNEDVRVTCRPTNESFAHQLLSEPISCLTSFELLERKDGSTVLLETEAEVPLLGYREFGSGNCYYFNTCQHSCLRHMPSPLAMSPKLHDALRKVVARIGYECVKARSERQTAVNSINK